MTISSKPKLEVTAPKSPDEQTLKVKMPQGSTERSKKLIAKQKQAAATAAGRFELLFQDKNTHRVRTGPGKSGKSLSFIIGIFQDWKVLEKRPLVLESSENLLNSTKKYDVWEAVRRINIEILGVQGLM